MATDAAQIYNTFHNEGKQPDQFASSEWQWIADSYSGNNTNSTQFLTTPLKTQFVDYHNAYITIPMKMVSAIGTWSAIPLLAFKQSVLDLIGNITISTDQGQTIVNESNTFFINNLRTRLEKNVQWRVMEGPEIAYSPDKFPLAGVNNNFGSTSATYDGTAAVLGNVATQNLGGVTGVPQTNTIQKLVVQTGLPIGTSLAAGNYQGSVQDVPYYNQGFADRITILRDTASKYGYANATTGDGQAGQPLGWDNTAKAFYYTAVIPLRFLHDFFMQMNFPIFNVGFQLNLYFTQPNGASPYGIQFPPMMTADNTALAPLTGASPQLQVFGQSGAPALSTVTAPIITYANIGSNSGCRLWYKSVKYSPEDAARVAEMFSKGYTRSVKFLSTDYVPWGGLGAIAPGGAMNQTLTTSVVQPLRVWVLLYPVFPSASGDGTSTNLQPTNALQRSDYSWGVIPGFLQDVQLQVNNLPYFRNVINQGGNYPQDWYERIKEQVPAGWGSDFSYQDYIHTWCAHCIDVSRLSDRLQSPTQSVSLQITANRADKGNFNVVPIFLIERQNMVTFRFSSSDVSLVVGNIEGS